MAEETKDKLANVVSHLFKEGATITQNRKRPSGQSKTSVSSYYNERFANEVKNLLDEIYASGNDGLVLYKKFPNLSKSSLYLRINQGMRFLVDNMDFNPPNHYKSITDRVRITREKDYIRISIKTAGVSTPLSIEQVIPVEKELDWKDKMEDFFTNSKPGATFEQKNLNLSPEEINNVKVQMIELSNFLIEADRKHIKILHITSDV